MEKISPILLLAILVGGIGFLVLAWRFFRPAEPEVKRFCPACTGEGQLLRQEFVDPEDGGLSIERRLTYHCPCGNTWVVWVQEKQLIPTSGFNPKMN